MFTDMNCYFCEMFMGKVRGEANLFSHKTLRHTTPLIPLKGAFRDIKPEFQDTDKEAGTLHSMPWKLHYFCHLALVIV